MPKAERSQFFPRCESYWKLAGALYQKCTPIIKAFTFDDFPNLELESRKKTSFGTFLQNGSGASLRDVT